MYFYSSYEYCETCRGYVRSTVCETCFSYARRYGSYSRPVCARRACFYYRSSSYRRRTSMRARYYYDC